MATYNIDKIKQKIQAEADRKNGGNFGPRILWWKPTIGDNRIRLTPPWTSEGHNSDMPFREVCRHWNIGEGGHEPSGKSFTCPVKTEDGPGGECPVCDEVSALRATGSEADQDIAKLIYAKRRFYSNIIDLDDPVYTEEDLDEWEENARDGDECHFDEGDTKVQIMSYGPMIYNQLLELLQDVDLCDLGDSAVALKLKRTGKGKNDTEYMLRTDPRGEAFEFVGDIKELEYDLDSILPFPKEGEMAACLAGETEKKPEGLASRARTASKALSAEAEEVVEKPKRSKRRKKEDPEEAEAESGSVAEVEAAMRKLVGG